MRGVRQTIHAAQRRLLVGRLIEHAGTGLAWGAAAGLGAVIVDRLVGLGTAWWWLAGIPMIAGAAVGIVRAVLSRPSALIAAGTLDDALALRDRLTTGLTLMAGQDAAFTALALREADVAAASADPGRAVRYRFGGAWSAWPVLAGIAACIGLFVPQFDLLGRERAARVAAIEQTRQREVAEQLSRAMEAVAPEVLQEPEERPGARPSQLAELEKLREELESGAVSADDATARAVSELQAIAERAELEAQQAAERSRAVGESLSGLGRSSAAVGTTERDEARAGAGSDAPGGEGQELAERASDEGEDAGPEPESALTRAVRDRDLAAAREAARELMRRERLSPEERRTLAEDLDRLAADLEQLEAQEQQREEQERAAAEAAKRERGELQTENRPEEMREEGASGQQPQAPGERAAEPPRAGEEMRPEPQGGQRDKQQQAESAKQQTPQKTGEPDGKEPEGQGQTGQQAKPEEQTPQQGSPREEQGAKGAEGEKSGERTEERTKAGELRAEEGKADERTRSADKAAETSPGEEKGGEGQRGEVNEGERAPGEAPSGAEQREPGAAEVTQPGQKGKPGEGGERREINEQQLREQFEKSGMSPEEAQRAAERVARDARREEAQRGAREDRRELAERLKEASRQLSGEKNDGGRAPSPDSAQGHKPEAEQPGAEPGAQMEKRDQGTREEGQEASGERGEQPEPGVEPEEEPGDGKLPDEIPAPTKETLEQLAKHLERMTADDGKQRSDRETGERAREQAQKLAEKLSPAQQERLKQWAEGLARERPDLAERFANEGEPRPRGDRGEGEAEGDMPREQPSAGAERGVGDGPEGTRQEREATGTERAFPPSRTEIVDARDAGTGRPGTKGQRDQVVAEWLAPPTPGSATGAGPAAAAERMRRAARSAQQAVDERAIPSRYDRLVQRYFRRLPEKVAERAEAAGTPVPAQDAP
jgi:hypothetical protein